MVAGSTAAGFGYLVGWIPAPFFVLRFFDLCCSLSMSVPSTSSFGAEAIVETARTLAGNDGSRQCEPVSGLVYRARAAGSSDPSSARVRGSEATGPCWYRDGYPERLVSTVYEIFSDEWRV
ncbi:hypothetical protein P152DRAFT_248693 [Eremomyces bilateralis CBS 781.70]|uniref:Uncharacterized protein n=1 Tax=Eremomyces bilateralis CBS 781.70 TaxID=1392243 RepID=A0A6G1GAT4_9PEZI|nr:uncharacterized protein P152DRAFT_248693 [Eremomyces bilateralis CBS 781.70]KAF1815207.1 hypothetical protein P152DRAFT_248693 [Eremomyces bilateralis CBS 781.70]